MRPFCFPVKDAVDLIIKGKANIVSVDDGSGPLVVWRDGERIISKDSHDYMAQVVDADLGISRWYWRALS